MTLRRRFGDNVLEMASRRRVKPSVGSKLKQIQPLDARLGKVDESPITWASQFGFSSRDIGENPNQQLPEHTQHRVKEAVKQLLKDLGVDEAGLEKLEMSTRFVNFRRSITALTPEQLGRAVARAADLIRDLPDAEDALISGLKHRIYEITLPFIGDSTTALTSISRVFEEVEFEHLERHEASGRILPPQSQQHDGKMAQGESIIVAVDGTLVKDGVRYQPLSVAAAQSQTHRTTLLRWINSNTRIGGQPLRSYYFAPLDGYFVSEDSIRRAANRFVTWPAKRPAGAVTLGATKNRSGFLSLPEAQAIVGVSKRTMYLWAVHGKAPTDKPLDVIQCTTSQHFYIRERDAYELKRLVPPSGLHRGRRVQPALSPS